MKSKLSNEQVMEWRKLADCAAKVESMLGELRVEVAQSKIDDAHKLKVLEWIERAETFRGLSYFCIPQSEWLGGDSSKDENFCYRLPHIAASGGGM